MERYLAVVKDIEIEIQVKLEGADKLEKFLKKEAKFTGDNYQKDEYFTPPHKDYLKTRPVVEWLRIRESIKNSINYKLWHYDKTGRSQYCDEYETSVEDVDQVRKIFKAEGNRLIATVEKKRKTWIYKNYEVAIDHISNLGDFVEVEFKGKTLTKKPEEVTEGMIKFLKEAGCTNIQRNYVGYPFMILFPKEVKFEKV